MLLVTVLLSFLCCHPNKIASPRIPLLGVVSTHHIAMPLLGPAWTQLAPQAQVNKENGSVTQQ